MTNGFIRVASAVPRVNVADVTANLNSIIDMASELYERGVEIAVFPEMCITGYTCADLFHSPTLLEASSDAIATLSRWAASHPRMALIVGAPLREADTLYNCAVIITASTIQYVAKTYIPTYNEFYERRWWASAYSAPADLRQRTFAFAGVTFGVEICEDLWVAAPPSSALSLAGAEVIFNLSASDDVIGKYTYLRSLISQQSGRCVCAYVYSSAGFGESSTDLVFTGKAIIAENGATLAESDRWERQPHYTIADVDIEALRHDRMHLTTFADCRTVNGIEANTPVQLDSRPPFPSSAINQDYPLTYRTVNPRPFVPPTDEAIDHRCEEIINIQCAGLARRLSFIHCSTLTVGISGGLDSTLALLVAARTFDMLGLDRKGIIGVTMPGFGTTGRTYRNALAMMEALGVTIREIPIGPAVDLHFSDIGHDKNIHDVTYENSQARERTQILMDVANQTGGIVLGTGDLSELALGWATYNGDHMSMYGINAGVPKTLVKYLVQWFASRSDDERRRTLIDVIDTPISPELLPADTDGSIAQKTEDLVGPYELHDFFLYYMLRFGTSPRRVYYLARNAFEGQFDDATILHWMRTFYRRFFSQQFKRSCLPDGPKVGSVCLSPRGDWRMPSDASAALWLSDCDTL